MGTRYVGTPLGEAVLTSTHNLCFLSRNKKNNVYPCKPQFYYINVGFKESKLYRYVFVMETVRFRNTVLKGPGNKFWSSPSKYKNSENSECLIYIFKMINKVTIVNILTNYTKAFLKNMSAISNLLKGKINFIRCLMWQYKIYNHSIEINRSFQTNQEQY